MEISVKLSIEEWNTVLDILSDASVKRALPLINKIVAQAREQGLGAGVPVQTDGVVEPKP